MDEQRIIYLIRQYEMGSITAAEEREFDQALNDEANHDMFVQAFNAAFENHQPESSFLNEDYTAAIERILSIDRVGTNFDSSSPSIGGGRGEAGGQEGAFGQAEAPYKILPPAPSEEEQAKVIWFNRWAVAASIVIAVAIGSFLILNRKTTINNNIVITSKKTDVAAPAITRATIILSNGNKVFVDSAGAGTIAQQGKTDVVKNSNGTISYSPSVGGGRGEAGTEMLYNTLVNPRGSKVVSLVLQDGTQVWLNAESSLKYPVAFNGKERTVTITGEAYFEVVHNNKMPFKVKAGNQLIEDIGTHFNVNAYADEPVMKTTLIEGAVKVSLLSASPSPPIGGTKGGQEAGRALTLKPGQQAQVDASGITLSPHASVEEAIAWKTGFFSFSGADLQTVMRQMARWYDVEVSYEGGISKDKFTGEIDRNITLSKVLDNLARSRVHFRIEGKKLILTP